MQQACWQCDVAMKIRKSFGIYKAIYHNGSFLLLFGKRNKSFETYMNNFS